MDILFGTAALRRLCHDRAIALRLLSPEAARRLLARLDDLNAAASLAYAKKLPGRFSQFASAELFAIQLGDDFRLLIAPADKPLPRLTDGKLNLDKITSITVTAIGKNP